MITKVITSTFFKTVDKRIFYNEEEALEHEDKILKDMQESMDLRQLVNIKEIFYNFPSNVSGENNLLGNFEVSDVTPTIISVVNTETQLKYSHDFKNWHKNYLHQIFNLIERMRGDAK